MWTIYYSYTVEDQIVIIYHKSNWSNLQVRKKIDAFNKKG